MIKVQYIGDPLDNNDGPDINESYGYTFRKFGDFVDVSGEAAEKLPRNRHFRVEEIEDADFVEVSSAPETLELPQEVERIEKPKRKRRTKAEMEAARAAE